MSSKTYTMKKNTNVEPFFVTANRFPKDWRSHYPSYMTDKEYERQFEFINRCLCAYWKSLKNINTQEAIGLTHHAMKMRRQLDDLASSGYGIYGVNDLNDALSLLDKDTELFRDTEFKRYFFGELYEHNVWAPAAFVEFANEFDEKIKQLKADYRDHLTQTQAATVNANKGSWHKCKNNLKMVKKIAEQVNSSSWLLDSYAIGRSSATQSFMQTTQKYGVSGASSATRFVDVIGRVDAVIKMYDGMKKQLGTINNAEETAMIFAALRAAVDFLPIIGGFYGAMLDAIPGVIESYKKAVEPHYKLAEMVNDSPEMFAKLQSSPSKKLCKQCGKMTLAPCTDQEKLNQMGL